MSKRPALVVDGATCPCGKQKETVLDLPEHLHGTRTQNTVCVDTCIVPQIQALWAAEIATAGSCCGHGATWPGIVLWSADEAGRAKEILRRVDPDRQWTVEAWVLAKL